MENPNRKIWRAVGIFLFGVACGFIPTGIQTQELRGQVEQERAAATKLNEGLRDALADAKNELRGIQVDRNECVREAGADGSETVIVTQNHPYAGWQQNIRGVTLTVPVPSYPPMVSPVIVVRGLVRPNTLDGVGGVVYTHLYPDGHTDGWRQPGRAE